MPTNLGNIVIEFWNTFQTECFYSFWTSLIWAVLESTLHARWRISLDLGFTYYQYVWIRALTKEMNIHQGCWELYSRFAHISDTSDIVYCFGFGSLSFPEYMEAGFYNKLIIKKMKSKFRQLRTFTIIYLYNSSGKIFVLHFLEKNKARYKHYTICHSDCTRMMQSIWNGYFIKAY